MTFGEKLQKLRTRAGLSQDQLAELLDVSRQAVSKWERNEAMPEAEKLVRISRQFGVSTDYLLLEELEEPETASTTAPAAGLWVRVKQWYRNRGYLLAWVLAAWGVWNLVDLAVLAVNTYQQAQDLENFAWVKYVQMVYIPTMIPHVLLILVSVILVFRGRQLIDLAVLHREAQMVHRIVVAITLHKVFDLDHTNNLLQEWRRAGPAPVSFHSIKKETENYLKE